MTPATATLGLRYHVDQQRLAAADTAAAITEAFPDWEVTARHACGTYVFDAGLRDRDAAGLCAVVNDSAQAVRAALLGWEFPGWEVTADKAPAPDDPRRQVIRAVRRDPAPNGGIQVVISPSMHEVRAALRGEKATAA